jgi:hypothetical protein
MQLLFLAQDSAAHAAGAGLAGFGIVLLMLALLASLFWIWMIIDCLTSRSLVGVEKAIWLLVIFFLHLLGALIYFFVGRGSRGRV